MRVTEQIDALNTTTSGLIERTSEMLATQTVEIHKQATTSTVSVTTIRRQKPVCVRTYSKFAASCGR